MLKAKQKTFELNMTKGPILKQLIVYALPIIFTNILQLLFNAADVAVLGAFIPDPVLADRAVAAVGATNALVNLIIGLFVGLSVGANVIIARCIGEENKEKAEKIVCTSVLVSLIGGVVLMIVGISFAEIFLRWMQCEESVLPLATKYLRIYFIGMPIMMLYNFSASILRAVGDTKRPLIFLAIGGVINVVLNILFVTAFHQTVEGVAIATLTSQGISAVLSVIVLLKSTGYSKLNLKKLKIYFSELKEMLQIGIPAGLQGCAFSLSNVLIQSAINSLGQETMTASAAASQLDGFIFNAMTGIGLAAVAFVSQNLGAHNFKRVRKTVRCCLMLVVVVGIVMAGIILLLRRPLVSIFTENEAITQLAYKRLFILGVPYFIGGIMDTMGNVMRGLGKSTTAMLISIFGNCVFRIIWLNTVCKFWHTFESVFLVFPISWALTVFIYVLVYFPTIKKLETQYTTKNDFNEEEVEKLSA